MTQEEFVARKAEIELCTNPNTLGILRHNYFCMRTEHDMYPMTPEDRELAGQLEGIACAKIVQLMGWDDLGNKTGWKSP